jgi:uncharacterized membrane protein HdeD (DUF308 family)
MKKQLLMKRFYLKNWWTLTIKGIFTIILGTLAIMNPLDSLNPVISLFGIGLLVTGIMLIVTALIRKVRRDRAWNLTEGFLDIMVATIFLSLNEVSTGLFLTILAIWISFIGILHITNRYRLNGLFNHWRYLIFNGILAIIFAVLIFTFPMQGMVTRGILIILQVGILIGFILVSSFHVKRLMEDIRIDIPHKEGEEGNQELSYY